MGEHLLDETKTWDLLNNFKKTLKSKINPTIIFKSKWIQNMPKIMFRIIDEVQQKLKEVNDLFREIRFKLLVNKTRENYMIELLKKFKNRGVDQVKVDKVKKKLNSIKLKLGEIDMRYFKRAERIKKFTEEKYHKTIGLAHAKFTTFMDLEKDSIISFEILTDMFKFLHALSITLIDIQDTIKDYNRYRIKYTLLLLRPVEEKQQDQYQYQHPTIEPVSSSPLIPFSYFPFDPVSSPNLNPYSTTIHDGIEKTPSALRSGAPSIRSEPGNKDAYSNRSVSPMSSISSRQEPENTLDPVSSPFFNPYSYDGIARTPPVQSPVLRSSASSTRSVYPVRSTTPV